MGIQRPRFSLLVLVSLGITAAHAQPTKAPAPATATAAGSDSKAKEKPAATAKTAKKSNKEAAKSKAATAKPAKTTAPAKGKAETKATQVAATDAPVLQEGTTTTRSGPKPVRQRAASVSGATGLDKTWSADPGPEGTTRLRLSLGYFDADDFPNPSANDVFVGSNFAVAYTPHRWVETFLSIRATSNTVTFSDPEEEADPRVELLQTQGDTTLGAKFGGFIKDDIAVAAAAAVKFASGVGSAGFDLGATNVDLRVLGTFDFTRKQNIPVRTHFEVSYLIENTESLFDTRVGEPTLAEEFGLQIARYNRLGIGIGLEIPFDEYISPFFDYRVEVPLLVELSRRSPDSNELSFSSIPHGLTVGVRSFPLENLAVDVAARIGFSSEPYTGVPATPPWQLIFGVGYTLDPRPVVELRTVVKKVAAPKPKVPKAAKNGPQLAFVAGKVLDAKTKKPIAGAQVLYAGHKGKAAQLTDGKGGFAGYAFPPGKKLRVRASAPGYGDQSVNVVPKLGKLSTVELTLAPGPKTSATAHLEVRIFDALGRPLEAKVVVDGKAAAGGMSKPGQPFKIQVSPGPHALVVTKKGFEPAAQATTVKAGKTATLRIKMETRRRGRSVGTGGGGSGGGGGAAVRFTNTRVKLRGGVQFEGTTATLTAKTKRRLDALARAMKRRNSLKRLRVAVHTDNRGGKAQMTKLSNERARAIKSHLVKKGVAAGRLQPRGYGGDKPVAPNLTARGRAKNNRVLFVILEGR